MPKPSLPSNRVEPSARESTRLREKEQAEFDSEIMSIIGSINLRANLLRNKLNIEQKKSPVKPKKESRGISGKAPEEILVDMDGDFESNSNSGEMDPGKATLDQTIMIGDLEESNELDELKFSQSQPGEDSLRSSMLKSEGG